MKNIDLQAIDENIIDVSLLSPNMQLLISEIGFNAALKLVERYGGCLPCIPIKPISGHKLEVLLGRNAFIKLCRLVGGDKSFYVPKMDKVLSKIKEHIAVNMSKSDDSATTIAQFLEISHRHAQRIKCKTNNNHNLDFFK